MKKFLKYAFAALGLLLLFASLGFLTFVYNVFEGGIADIRKGIPRTVDFHLGKKALEGDFVEFPEPVFWPYLSDGAHFSQLRASKLGRYVERDLGLKRVLGEVKRIKRELGRIPLVAPGILEDVIGKDLAVAGRFRQGRDPAFCVYTKVSWKICSFIGLLSYESMRSQFGAQGLQISPAGKLFELKQGAGTPFYLTRVLDLVILGNDKDFVEESRKLAAGESQKDTLFVSPDYSDLVTKRINEYAKRTETEANALEFNLSLRALSKAVPAFAQWPGAGPELSQEMKLVRSFVNTPAMLGLWGACTFEEESLGLLLSLDLNRNRLSDAQTRLLSEPQAPMKNWLLARMNCVPSTAAAFFFLRIPVQVFLSEFFLSLDKDTRDLIELALRKVGQRGGFAGLASQLSPALKPYVIVIIRNNDYRKFAENEFEVKIPSPLPATAWVFEVKSGMRKRAKRVLDLLTNNYKSFGFGSRFKMDTGPNRSVRILEWGNANIEGTGQVAIMDGGPEFNGLLMLSNSGKLLRECVNSRFGSRGARNMFASERLQQVVRGYADDTRLSGFCWVNGDRVRDILKRYESFARDQARSEDPDPNWMLENRSRIANMVFQREFRNRAGSKEQLTGKARKDFEARVGDVMRVEWGRQRRGRGQSLSTEFAEFRSYLQYLDSGYVFLKNEARAIRAEGRVFLRY